METDLRLKIAPVFRRNRRPQKDTPNLLLQLPPELRNRIYELLLLTPYSAPWKEPPLLRTCKRIRGEALMVHYGNNKFVLCTTIELEALQTRIKRIERIVSLCGPKPFGSLRIVLVGGIWNNLHGMLPLLELMRATGFEPASQEYQLPEKVHGYRPTTRSSVFILEREHMALQNSC